MLKRLSCILLPVMWLLNILVWMLLSKTSKLRSIPPTCPEVFWNTQLMTFFSLHRRYTSTIREVTNKSCVNKLLKGFEFIYESHHYEYENHVQILRRFVNSFSKGYSTMKTEEIKIDKKDRKKKKERDLRHSK